MDGIAVLVFAFVVKQWYEEQNLIDKTGS